MRTRTATSKPKRGFLDGYKTYDPNVEGYGSPEEWEDNFRDRIGYAAAKETVGNDSPRGILGVSLSATWNEIRTAYRNLSKKFHPDLNPGINPALFRKLRAAYEMLEREFGFGKGR